MLTMLHQFLLLSFKIGVVGLAIAQRLSQKFHDKSTYLVERHGRAGEEIRYVNQTVDFSALP